MPKFENVSCSQCGESFGPGDEGSSGCDRHDFVLRDSADKEVLRISFEREKTSARLFIPHESGQGRTVLLADIADITNLRNWLERNLGCLYDQGSEDAEPIADGERG